MICEELKSEDFNIKIEKMIVKKNFDKVFSDDLSDSVVTKRKHTNNGRFWQREHYFIWKWYNSE